MNAFFGSVRGRLTLHSLLVTAPVVAGLLIALYFGALSAFEAQDRTELEEETETALALLSARPELPPSSALAPLLNEADGESDSHLWLGRADAPLLAKPAGSRLQPLPEGVRWRDLKLNEIVIGEGRDAQGQRQRVASVRLPSTAGGELHLQIARLLKPPAQQRLHWRLGLAAVFLLLVALSTLITWVMTGRTLRPVMRMIVAAENYDPGRNRLPVSAAGDDEFAALALSLNRILARLEDATLQSRRFSADAAHELRTPLAGLRVMLEVAQSRPRSPKEMAQLFGDALDELTRIDRRLDALLRLARIEAGERPAAGPEIAIAAWCEERLQPWRRECEASGITLSVTGTGVSRLPEEWLQILIDNLLGNALRHTSRGGAIQVEMTAAAGLLKLRVADNGSGIEPAQHAAIWERFVRGTPAASAGSGLGLSLCDAICRQLGGTREMRSAPGAGAEFVFALPEPVADAS